MTIERKTFEGERQEDRLVVTTSALDRDRDRVMPKGLRLDRYRANPVLMFGHNYRDPWALIGEADDIQVEGDRITISPKFRSPANDNDPMTIIKALWDQGLLRAASIGFENIKGRENEAGGRDIYEADLVEISIVPIPANQEALRIAVKAVETPVADVSLSEDMQIVDEVEETRIEPENGPDEETVETADGEDAAASGDILEPAADDIDASDDASIEDEPEDDEEAVSVDDLTPAELAALVETLEQYLGELSNRLQSFQEGSSNE